MDWVMQSNCDNHAEERCHYGHRKGIKINTSRPTVARGKSSMLTDEHYQGNVFLIDLKHVFLL